ncbi:MAG TPA: hypothetical protein VFG51_00470 [Candidatus Saccharimonadia bacterium]|nr:hypothetical protein [Candidatus Saccharimonadia bacterium]
MTSQEHSPQTIIREAIVKKLKELYASGGILHGHATSTESQAQAILKHGLKLERPVLATTAWPLHDLRFPIGEDLESTAQMIQDWPYHSAVHLRWIVIVRTDRGLDGNTLLQPLPKPEGKLRYLLPKQYVAGYFDNQTGKFTGV